MKDTIFGIRIPKTAALQLPLKKGALLWDENNKEYIDAIAWWVNPYGHSNTFIADATTTDNIRTCFVWWFTRARN
jgi:adenosylmethionine-8-amino-7-oxononanoate aminotransferase